MALKVQCWDVSWLNLWIRQLFFTWRVWRVWIMNTKCNDGDWWSKARLGDPLHNRHWKEGHSYIMVLMVITVGKVMIFIGKVKVMMLPWPGHLLQNDPVPGLSQHHVTSWDAERWKPMLEWRIYKLRKCHDFYLVWYNFGSLFYVTALSG